MGPIQVRAPHAASRQGRLRIGIDFDNTIISYDEVFRQMAKDRGLIGPDFTGHKQALRDTIRLLPDGEIAWQCLQGQVYGKGIASARIITGFESFLRRCRREGCSVSVVSHKTVYGHYDPDRVNLRTAALDWMVAEGLTSGEHAIALSDIYFESTRAEKLSRIAKLSLTHFIDDLEEVLSDPDFPPGVTPVLFAADGTSSGVSCLVCTSWKQIEEQIFGRA